jgi:hypothetical protein
VKSGHDTAIAIPFLNQGTFWHTALPESCSVTAHIVFFDSVGNPVEAAYPGMWLNAALCPANFGIGQVHELILALAQDHKQQIFESPRNAAPGGSLLPTFLMLTTKEKCSP